MDFNAVADQFTATAARYAGAIQPYALNLFLALFFIDVLVAAIQYMVDQGDAPHYVGRLLRHILSGGFIYLMIVNAFPWMSMILQSFSRIGAATTGLPNLNPDTVLKLGGTMAETIFDTPANVGLMQNLELAIVQSVAAFFILLSFVIAAAMLLLTVIESYLVVAGATLLLGFGGSRWTAPIAEGYFGYVIRVGTRLLFFYLVLGIGVQIASQWQAMLTAICSPVATALPWYSTYGVPPSKIMTTVCSNAIPVRTMLDLTALSIVFLIVTIAVPYTAAGIAGGTVGLALNHAFEAAYIAQTVVRPITSALQTGFNKVAQIGNGSGDTNGSATGWAKSSDFPRQTQQLSNLGSDGSQRVLAPKDVRGTSIMPSRAPNTMPINSATAHYGNTSGTTATARVTRKA